MKQNREARAKIVANALRARLSTSAIAKVLGKECPATRQLIKTLKKAYPALFWGMPGSDEKRIVLPSMS